MKAIDRKLVRDVLHMKGQVLAICAVIACGVATFVMSLSALDALRNTQATYYDRYRFGQVFANLKRAPNSLAARLETIPGVAAVQTRVLREVTLDLPELSEPAVGRLISVPENQRPGLNELYLRSGRWVEPGSDEEVIVSEGFAEAHKLLPGSHITAIMNGRKKRLKIVGIALSPEYIYTLRAGALVPDDKRFGIFWMGERALSAAFDMEGAFNDVSLSLMPGTNEEDVIAALDRLVDPYGGLGAYGRENQISHRFISDEIKQLSRMGTIIPAIFLGVAAFLLNVVLSRIIALQRDQIAALKAFGYSNFSVGIHYMKLVLMVVIVGVLAGTVVGRHLGWTITQIYAKFYRFPMLQFAVPGAVVAGAFVFSFVAALVGTLGVIRKAVKLPPAEAMRPEPPTRYQATVLERLGLGRWFDQPTRMILRHLERRPVKSFLSTFGISLSVAIIILGRFSADSLDYILDAQFEVTQRQDITVSFFEPSTSATLHEMEHLPGVIYAEPQRTIPVRFRHGHLSKRTIILGLPERPLLNHLVDAEFRPVPVPSEGLIFNTKLAQLLNVKVGDVVTVEVLEGERPVRQVPVAALTNEFLGTFSYMNLSAANRLMREGRVYNGAYLQCDQKSIETLYRQLKNLPRVAAVTIKAASVKSFRETVMENMLQMQASNVIFACIIAFGVVYNTARIALSERGRELASLRVIGFTRGEISYILLGELAVLTVLAIPLGVAMGCALVKMICLFLDTEMYRIPFVIAPKTFGFSILIVLVAAILSGLVVRRRLDELDLVAVLKTRE